MNYSSLRKKMQQMKPEHAKSMHKFLHVAATGARFMPGVGIIPVAQLWSKLTPKQKQSALHIAQLFI